ncbi:arginase family protein [Agromyces sp. Marseille-Q5079]|uniref:arginase family protein n=1 Tax=Agromyces sp. Marseille-Q5079 TaxID=3439059 RepID=UPI003D9CAC9F
MISLLSAPSNLGLRPPVAGGVPGASKAPEALREAGLHRRFARLGAHDAGVVLPGRYVDDDATRPADLVRNEAALIAHARLLADRVGGILDTGGTPLVLGGDCSILLGIGVALARRGRRGLLHVDGHTDFRHPGNSDECASVAGEDLAAAVGLHRPSLADLDGFAPYFSPSCTVHLGHRDDDDAAAEARGVLGLVVSARAATAMRTADIASAVRAVAGTSGYWLQLDVDVLDPSVMPAVDSPDPGGLSIDGLAALLSALAPGAVGASVTVFDPDLDPDGRYAHVVADLLVDSFARLGADA